MQSKCTFLPVILEMHTLVIGAVFLNEGHVLDEWLQHYVRQGVGHFILIDNGSTDEPLKVLQPWIVQGMVTYIIDKTRHDQVGKYNKYVLPRAQVMSEWILIVDLDEFMYGRRENLSTTLKRLGPHVGLVSVPWKAFGSAGRKLQPASVISGFCLRKHYATPQHTCVKSIVRSTAVKSLDIHDHKIVEPYECVGSYFTKVDACLQNRRAGDTCIDERFLQGSVIHLNHYGIQSLEWYQAVKMTRGSANCAAHDTIRTLAAFTSSDHNDVFDDELLRLSSV